MMAPCEITDDYYAILEVLQNDSVETIKKSYKRLALKLHFDGNSGKPDATASFQRVRCSCLPLDFHSDRLLSIVSSLEEHTRL